MGAKLTKQGGEGAGQEGAGQCSTLPASFRRGGPKQVARTGSLPRNTAAAANFERGAGSASAASSFGQRIRKSCRNWAAQRGIKQKKSAAEDKKSAATDAEDTQAEEVVLAADPVTEPEQEKELDIGAIVASLVVEAHKRKVASRIQSRAQSREMLLDTAKEEENNNKEEASQPDQDQAVASDSSQDEDDDVTADIENCHDDKHSNGGQEHEAETQQSPSPHHTPEEDKVDERFQEDGDEKMINTRGDESEEDKKTLDADESTKEDDRDRDNDAEDKEEQADDNEENIATNTEAAQADPTSNNDDDVECNTESDNNGEIDTTINTIEAEDTEGGAVEEEQTYIEDKVVSEEPHSEEEIQSEESVPEELQNNEVVSEEPKSEEVIPEELQSEDVVPNIVNELVDSVGSSSSHEEEDGLDIKSDECSLLVDSREIHEAIDDKLER